MNKIKLIYFVFFFILKLSFFSVNADPIFDEGKEIFLEKGMCSTCHVLSNAGSNGLVGPNLDEIKPDINRVIYTVTNGIGVMPAYQGELTEKEIQSVAHYVSVSVGN